MCGGRLAVHSAEYPAGLESARASPALRAIDRATSRCVWQTGGFPCSASHFTQIRLETKRQRIRQGDYPLAPFRFWRANFSSPYVTTDKY
jgi:hypothetical protein